MKELQLLIKPASAMCNMRCSYCFYEDEAVCRKVPSYGKMTQDVMEATVKNALDEFCMGNVKTDSFKKLWKNGREGKGFFENAAMRDYRCPACRWYPLCRGGCRRDCYLLEGIQRNMYCESYQEFFSYAIEKLEFLASF